MNIITKTRNDLKAYVNSLDTPENTVYKENELLILTCFSKAQEILEKNESVNTPDPSNKVSESMTFGNLTLNKPPEWDDDNVKFEIQDYDYDSTTISIDDLRILHKYIGDILSEVDTTPKN